ncbi:hypothetical protein E4U16_006902 [Claviceps sp. LM84 group G4]|nr:hypothetical protein E4U16_006902 [Claviceps sp. LM84 group G4]KAG6084870.1 hypothetical protein E4U33_002756 [Claviceps sp. LM78 group G4]
MSTRMDIDSNPVTLKQILGQMEAYQAELRRTTTYTLIGTSTPSTEGVALQSHLRRGQIHVHILAHSHNQKLNSDRAVIGGVE